jgi:uncharacterized membrane protein
MIESIYSFLAAIGFNHPLHPMLTHIPMGMIIGMVLFSLLGLVRHSSALAQTAFHCSVLALIFIIPVIAAGYMDWQHLMEGEWNIFIKIKMVLGGLLTILLVLAVILKVRDATPTTMLIIYLLCLACAGGLGFSGGSLVYG